jgi:agmatinase
MGLPGADSLTDKSIPTFARGELPHFAGINTFLKAPYVEDVHDVGKYDAAVLGIPFDSGTTYRPGTRFGPQGVRRISALYTPYNYEMGIDLREQMTLCDVGDVFTIPANIEKTFDQISRAVGHVFSSGALPIMIGGDHSIGFPCVRGIANCTSKRIGIIHFDRHIDIQQKDLDERMHTTPWYWATNLPNVSPKNLVQLGIGGWQVPGGRRGGGSATECSPSPTSRSWGSKPPRSRWSSPGRTPTRSTSPSTSTVSIAASSPHRVARPAASARGANSRPGRRGRRLRCRGGRGVSSLIPRHHGLVGVRVVVEVLGSLVANGKMGAHKAIIDKPVSF